MRGDEGGQGHQVVGRCGPRGVAVVAAVMSHKHPYPLVHALGEIVQYGKRHVPGQGSDPNGRRIRFAMAEH